MADAKPIRIHHNVPAFRSTTKQINISILGEEEDVHFVSTPTAAHPHRVISMHYNTPDGRPVSEFFREDGTPEEGVIDPKPQLLPDGPRWSPLDDEPTAEHQAMEPDGPLPGNRFRFAGQPHDMRPVPWKLLNAMWDRDERNMLDVEEEVWQIAIADGSQLKSAMHDLKNFLERVGYPRYLSKARRSDSLVWRDF